MTIFDLAYLCAVPLVVPSCLWKMAKHGKYKKSIPGMFGKYYTNEESWTDKSIWIHAVSVGEITGARALLPALKKEYPGYKYLLTVTTETGYATAEKLKGKLFDDVQFYPFDLSWNVEKFIRHFNPAIYIGLETELWPNLFRRLEEFRAKVFIINGRISPQAFGKYQLFSGLFRHILKPVTAFGMQSQIDAERMTCLVNDPQKIFVTNNLKFDIEAKTFDAADIAELRSRCGCHQDCYLVVMGSTHEHEEEMAIQTVLSSSSFESGHTMMAIVPRHPERFESVWQLLLKTDLCLLRYSTGEHVQGSINKTVVLIDAMGVLIKLYSIAAVGVVCGSFVDNVGGHNLLEPAIYGVPVVFGPYTWGQPEMVKLLLDNGGIQCNEKELPTVIDELISDSYKRKQLGNTAQLAVLSNRGAVEKSIELIKSFANLD